MDADPPAGFRYVDVLERIVKEDDVIVASSDVEPALGRRVERQVALHSAERSGIRHPLDREDFTQILLEKGGTPGLLVCDQYHSDTSCGLLDYHSDNFIIELEISLEPKLKQLFDFDIPANLRQCAGEGRFHGLTPHDDL